MLAVFLKFLIEIKMSCKQAFDILFSTSMSSMN
jgi:hypothetical protein